MRARAKRDPVPFKVQVNYRSGNSVVMSVNSFRVTRGEDEVSVTYESAGFPKPLLFSLDDVESIWQIG
jgi:hypothetical protein